MLKVVFTLDKFQEKIERSYIKIQKVAADIGGIIKFFSLIFSFLATQYSNLRFYDYLINFIRNEESQILNNFKTQDINLSTMTEMKYFGNTASPPRKLNHSIFSSFK